MKMKTKGVEQPETVVEGLRQAEARLQRTVSTLRESLGGEFSWSTWRRATERVQAILDAHPGRQEPAIAEALDGIDMLGDALAAIADAAPPQDGKPGQEASEARPKEEREVAAQFKTTLPSFSGKPDDLEGWRATIVTRLSTAGLRDYELMFGVISDGLLLPEALRSVVRNVRSWDEFWARLDRAVPFRDVRLAVWEHLASLKPLAETNSRAAVAEFQRGLEDFISRCEERGWKGNLEAQGLVEFVLDRMGTAVRERFFCWEDLKYDKQTTDLKRLNSFFESYHSALGRDVKDEGASGSKGSKDAKDGKKWSKPWAKDGKDGGKTQDAEKPKDGEGKDSKPAQASAESKSATETAVRMHAAGVAAAPGGPVYRPVTWVKVRADRRRSKWVALRCLVDEGCEVSFISSDAARKLGFAKMEGRVELTLSYFGGRSQRSGGVPGSIKLQGLDKGMAYPAVVCELEELHETMAGVKIPSGCHHLDEALPHIPGEDGPLEMILGFDLKGLLLPSRVLTGGPCQPVAVATRVAWMIVPPIPGHEESGKADADGLQRSEMLADFAAKLSKPTGLQARRCAIFHRDEGVEALEEDVGALAELFQTWAKADLLGVSPTARCSCSAREIEEAEFITHIREAMRIQDGRVEVPLPWRPGFPDALCNNRAHVAAVQRGVMQRVEASDIQEAYQQEMEIILDQFAEPVDAAAVQSTSAWYLIHFPVKNRTKLRIVWNAAQKSHGLALNDGLYKGPVLLNNLMTILHGFRMRPVPVAGDIRKMYNQVQLVPRDRDNHRFLWHGQDYRWKRLVFGDKPAPDVAIATLHFLADRFATESQAAANLLKRSAYMDDIIFSVQTNEESRQAMDGVSAILRKGGFEVKQWETVPPPPGEGEETSILGVVWNKRTDELGIRVPPPLPSVWTKRKLLAWIATMWDPLGIAAPAAVGSKIKLQAMWDCARGWD